MQQEQGTKQMGNFLESLSNSTIPGSFHQLMCACLSAHVTQLLPLLSIGRGTPLLAAMYALICASNLLLTADRMKAARITFRVPALQ